MDTDNQQVIDVNEEEDAPPETGEPAADSAFFDQDLPVYSPKPGLNLNPPLLLALAFQVFLAGLVGLNGLKFFPFFNNFPSSGTGQLFGNIAALALAGLIQVGLVAGVAQVAKLDGTIWRWLTLGPLVGAVGVDLLLVFLAVTGGVSLPDGWQAGLKTPAGGVLFLAFAFLNIPSLFYSAQLLDQTGDEATRRKIEEKLRFIAAQMLTDADPKTQARAVRVWMKLGVNPLRFIPLHDSVLALLMANFTDKLPPYLGEAHWAYDFDSHTFAAIPADVHEALLGYAHRLGQGDSDDNTSLLWRLLPAEMVELLGHNLRALGKPRFIDITNPNRPRSLNRLIEMGALGYNEAKKDPSLDAKKAKKPVAALQPASTIRPRTPNQIFVASLTPAERALFGSYLTRTVFPHVRGAQYPPDVPDLSIFEAFDMSELLGNYSYWKKQAGSFV